MAMTHSNIRKAKKEEVYIKEDNPERLYMSKEKALRENQVLAKERAEQEKLKAEQQARREERIANEVVLDPKEVFDLTTSELTETQIKDIRSLEQKYINESGPDAKKRKEAILRKANEIKNTKVDDPETIFSAEGLTLSDEETAQIKDLHDQYLNAEGPGSTQKKKSLLRKAQEIRSRE